MKISMLKDDNVLMEDVRLVFRNFEGKEQMYNQEGDRNFCVIIDDLSDAEQMLKDGWNIKSLKSREPEEPDQPYLQISVGYKAYPPTIALITDQGSKKTRLGEDEIEVLDWIDIATADLIIRPYNWSLKDGRNGIKAYVKSLYIVVNEDALDLKYKDLEELPSRSGKVEE